MERKRIVEAAAVLLPIGLLALSFFGFSHETKKQAIELQHGMCPVCGRKLCKCVEAHHKLPASMQGNNSLANCVVVDGDAKHGWDCHETLDENALQRGLIFLSPDAPEVPIAEVPRELFKNNGVKDRVVRLFTSRRLHHGKHNR